MSFDGRVALVTGSTRGIGCATAEALAARGATVVVNGRTDDAVQAGASALRAHHGGEHRGLAFDVADADAVTAALREIFGEYRRLDVLINNAGTSLEAPLGMTRTADVQQAFAVSALGAINTMQSAARLLARGDGGAIVNIASIAGEAGVSGQVAYSGAKAAVAGITRAAAKELAPRVRVNAVAPGLVETDLLGELHADAVQSATDRIALGRRARPQEVAEAVVWLASDAASYVTGQILRVDGGMVA